MTREDKHKQLEELRDLARINEKTRSLVEERNEVIDKLNHNRPSDTYILTPTPKPKGDFELPKKKKVNKNFKESYEDGIQKTRNDYDQKIYDSVKTYFQNEGYYEYLEEVEELNKTEVGILMESNDGANKLIDYQKEKLKEQEKETSNKEPIQEIDVEKSIKLSNEERDKIIEHGTSIDFDENGKDIELGRDKAPSPSDDFE
ncbi:hypothetical protein Q4Q34_08575 [Flavivirga abyssicola]|uniref:hypothetical protein n=1 Tax=Flavivirga abyssicola TaxID=3063533 RepID=UPI0026DF8232|nr:hypothetical protein [Flavivirga sp. MEBiC07777]WVK15081.1 hypothetical protein Q4Q34_08575 [Flavivirga sp. MEBiC07777]